MPKGLPAIRTKSGFTRADVARSWGLSPREYRKLQSAVRKARWFGEEEPHSFSLNHLLRYMWAVVLPGQYLCLVLPQNRRVDPTRDAEQEDELVTLLASRSLVEGHGMQIFVHRAGKDPETNEELWFRPVWHFGGADPKRVVESIRFAAEAPSEMVRQARAS